MLCDMLWIVKNYAFHMNVYNMTSIDTWLLNDRFQGSYFKLLCIYRLHDYTEDVFIQ